MPTRARKAKPPPGIITAGGVDMARAHASGIQPRDPTSPEPCTDQPRVVVAVETDLRKVPTHKRLLEGREAAADAGRSALLPGGDSLRTTPTSTGMARPARAEARRRAEAHPAAAPVRRGLPAWTRVALALALLGTLAGAARWLRVRDGEGAAAFRASTPTTESPSGSESTGREVVTPLPVIATPVPRAAAVEVVPPAATASASAEARPRPARPAPAPAPRSAFSPPFQLPGEKY